MDGIYNLKERLCEELEEIGRKPTWDAGDLELVDKLAHAMKNINKIIEQDEAEEYGSRGDMGYGSRYNDYNYRNDGMSYSRSGRYNRSGRYSRYSMADPGIANELRDIMRDVQDENARRDLQKIIDNMSK